MTKMYYLTYQFFPSEKANSIQSMSNIKYFIKNSFNVTLIYPLRNKNIKSNESTIKEFYNLNKNLTIRGLKHNLPFGKFSFLEKFFFLLSHYLWTKKVVKRLIRTENLKDIIFFTRSEWFFYFLSKRNLQVVYECHQLSKLKKLLIPIAMKSKSSKLILLNDVLLEDLKLDKSTFSKVMTLHNGVDSDLFSNIVKKDPHKIIFIGNFSRFNEDRNINFIIDAFSDLRLKAYNLSLVGAKGKEYETFLKIIKQKKLEDRIQLTTWLDRESSINEIQTSSIGLLMNSETNIHSTRHTSPLKYFEYLYGNLKVVAVDFVSHRKLPYSEHIFFFQNNNTEQFIEAILNTKKHSIPENFQLDKITLDFRAKSIIELINR